MTKLIHSFSLSLVAAGLLASTAASAESLAIVNATVYTSTEQGILKNASIIIDEGKIVAINPKTISADTTFDAQGNIVTPGFIGSMNQLGLVEVSAVSGSRDAGDDKADIDFDPIVAFNPRTSLIPYARKGGITRDVVTPQGGESIFAGLASVVDLSGQFDSVKQREVALVVYLGENHKGSRAMSVKTLVDTLTKHKQKSAPKSKKEDETPSTTDKILTKVLAGNMPLLVSASRASDIVELIKIKEQFSLNLVLAGAQDAVVVKEQLAKAQIPVMINAMDDLPNSFDSLHASLENAGILEKAGVKVILNISNDGSHNVYQLRFDAGNAVSYGMSQSGALKAVTANVADVFDINAGRVAVGKAADLVVWSGDPFELNSHVTTMFINGEEVSTNSRQDKLRERYMADSPLPAAYQK